MKKLEDVGVLVARILMPILFIVAGWGKITGYAGTQQYMEAMGVPGFLLPLTILLEFGGGLAVLFGFLTRTTALFTAGFTVLTAFIFHSNFAEGVNSLMFMKNLTIAGGFLLLAVTGPGFVMHKNQHFDTMDLAITAAIQGLGVAIADETLVAEDVHAGRLVRPYETSIKTGASYRLVMRETPGEENGLAAFRACLLNRG